MTLDADSLLSRADPISSADGNGVALALDALCRTARAQFQVTAAAIRRPGEAAGRLDVADEGQRGFWLHAIAAIGPSSDADGIAVISGSVAGIPSIQFAASIGLGDGSQMVLLDERPKRFSPAEERQLADLAAIAESLCRLEQQLRAAERQEEHFRLLAETSTDTIIRGNLAGIRLYVSPAIRELLGYEPEELVGRRAIDITHPDDIPALGQLMANVRTGDLDVGRIEQRMLHKDGSWSWIEAHIRLTHDKRTGDPDGYVVSVRALNDRKAIEARLEYIATHDELTGLPNRKLFRDYLTAAIEETWSGGRRFALLWMDIDRFKDINDSLGHQAGDVVLRMATQRFAAVIGHGDMVARLGGDEFALIAPIGPDNAVAGHIASRLIAAMAPPINHGGQAIAVGVSIGIACMPEAGSDPDELLAAADKALYAAKSSGRGSYCFCAASAPPV